MTDHTIIASCENGHTQEIHAGFLGLDWAQNQAALLDGTSPLYLHSPIGTDSPIGKCGTCGSQIKCTIASSETTK